MISNFEFLKNSKKYEVTLESQSEDSVFDFGHKVDKIAENIKTALAIAERDTIHDSLVPLVCEYISEQPKRRNTRIRGHREQYQFFTKTQTVGEGRVYGAGNVPWVNFITNNTGLNTLSSTFGAYSAGKLIGSSINLYSEDSGDGNDLSNIVDVYKIQSDQYSKSYRYKENDKFNSHTKINLLTSTDTRYILRGPWSLPMEPIGVNSGISAPQFLFPTVNDVLLTSKSIGRLGTYVVTNLSSIINTITFNVYNQNGTESISHTMTLGAYATSQHTSAAEVFKISGTSSDFIVAATRELDQAGEDLFVRVLSNNVNIMIEIHRVYEFEVGELFSNDIENDDSLCFYYDAGLSYDYSRMTGLYNAKASLGSFIGTIVSTLAPHVVDRVRDTWNDYKYNSGETLFSNIKRFFSKAISADQGKVGKASMYGCQKTERMLPNAKASTMSTLNAFITGGKVKKPSKMNDENKYNTRYEYPILERTGMAPMMGSVKTQFDPGYIQILTHSFPAGFQFFPVIVEETGSPPEVHVACMIKTHTGLSGITYNTINYNKKNSNIWFDDRLEMKEDVISNIIRYLEIGPGSLKINNFDVYITLDFDNTQFKGVEDESWMAAFTLLHNDAPDGLFTTGALYVDSLGQVLPKNMSVSVMNAKLKAVKGLTIFTTGEAIFQLGSRPYEELNIHSLNCPPYVTSTWGLWMVSIKPAADYKDILFKNGVLRSYKSNSEVVKNFHSQFNLLVYGSNANSDKYGKILGGEFTLLAGRLAIPAYTMMGARDRVLNTYQASDGFNVKKGNFDEKIDKSKLLNWLSYGYPANSTPMTVTPILTKINAVSDVTPPSSITPNLFLTLEADQIIASLASQLNTTVGNINVIPKGSKVGYNPSPIMRALADFRHHLRDTVTKPSDYVILLKIAIANIKNSLSASTSYTPAIKEDQYEIDSKGFITSSRFNLNNAQKQALNAILKNDSIQIKQNRVNAPSYVKAIDKHQEHKNVQPSVEEYEDDEEDVYTGINRGNINNEQHQSGNKFTGNKSSNEGPYSF